MLAQLRITGRQHKHLQEHLFPGDGNEAVAIALCGRHSGDSQYALCIQKLIPIPYADCSCRLSDRVTWSTNCLVSHIDEIIAKELAVVKIHSHPGYFPRFSEVDDNSDRILFESVYGWCDSPGPHASAVMLPGGEMFGRVALHDGKFHPLSKISIAGDDILHWYSSMDDKQEIPEFALRHGQLFGAGTIERLKRLSVAVVGCSGTGSPIIEMLARLGIGSLLLVDPDIVEEKNLNRIYNATMNDAKSSRPKVEVLARAIRTMGLGTKVKEIAQSLFDPSVVRVVAGCDVLFGCMDSYDGRYLLNKIASYYCIPYFDVGVSLTADGRGGVEKIAGAVHYLQPDGSSLLSRGVVTLEKVRAAGLRRINPSAYNDLLKEKYILGVQENRPAVISVNTEFSAKAVNEFLARIHPYRSTDNKDYAWRTALLTDDTSYNEPDGAPCEVIARNVGRGDVRPLLDMIELGMGKA